MDETDLSSFLDSLDMQPSLDASTWQTPSDFSFGDISNAGDGFQNVDLGNLDQMLTDIDLANTDWSSIYGDSALKDLPAQDFGGADTSKYMDEYNTNLQGIMDNQGGFTSGWQTVGSDRVMVQDDGSAIGINENGETYSLTPKQVSQMDKNGLLNSATSGYNTATGGTNIAPGGGKTTINADGSKTVTMSDGKTVNIDKNGNVVPGNTNVTPKANTPTQQQQKSGMDPMTMMMLMYLLSQMGKSGGSTSQAVIPQLQANRSQLPYSAPSRPGAGGTTYFTPTTYSPRMARGGEIVMANGGLSMHQQPQGLSSLGSFSDGGRLLKGPGDGVSDNIPATIAGKQPARLADGEFVVPARIVSELGNGSTDAGAKRLYEMMDRVQKARRKTKNIAADTKARKYLPA